MVITLRESYQVNTCSTTHIDTQNFLFSVNEFHFSVHGFFVFFFVFQVCINLANSR